MRGDPDAHSVEQIEEAIGKIFESKPAGRWIVSYSIYQSIICGEFGYHIQVMWERNPRLKNKVRRVLDNMAARGDIDKVPRGHYYYRPEGKFFTGRESLYGPKGSLALSEEDKRQYERDSADLDERQKKLRHWADMHGIEARFQGRMVLLTIDAFEGILVDLMRED